MIKNVDSIQGIVTNVDMALLYFEVNDKIRIYVDLMKEAITFPSKGDMVEISNLRVLIIDSSSKTGVMGPKTLYSFPTSNTAATQLYWKLRKNNMLDDPQELLTMNNLISKLEIRFPNTVIMKQLCRLLDAVERNSFKQIEVKFPEELNYVDDKYSNRYDFLIYDNMGTFNVYPSQSLEMPDSMDQFLFGVMDVDGTTGHFSLWTENANEKLFIRFTPYSGDLYKFQNTIVMIKKWSIFTEIFQLANTFTLKYILIDFENVVIVKTRKENKPKLFYGKNEKCPINSLECELFSITKLSEAIFGYNNQPECWMEGFMLSDCFDGKPTRVFLCYPNVEILPFLKENVVYKLINSNRAWTRNNDQLFGLRTGNQTFTIDKNTIFQETIADLCSESETLLNGISEVKNYIKSGIPQSHFFSCILKISRKQLQMYNPNFKPNHPRRFRRPMPYYGNPDDDHQMRLIFFDEEEEEYLDLYVNNKDSNVTPLGLLEDMVVKISHVQQSKEKYLRSSVFTAFQILEYSPKIKFSSVPLRLTDSAELNPDSVPSITPLGMYYSLPRTCIVKGPFMFDAIFDLTLVPICAKCKVRVIPGRQCSRCCIVKRDLSVIMVVSGQDARNPTFTMETEKNFFLKLLGLKNSKEWESFANAFFKCDGFKVDFTKKLNFDPDTVTRDAESRVMLQELVETIYSHINRRLVCFCDVVSVKKLDYPNWRMLDHRTIYNSEFCETIR